MYTRGSTTLLGTGTGNHLVVSIRSKIHKLELVGTSQREKMYAQSIIIITSKRAREAAVGKALRSRAQQHFR